MLKSIWRMGCARSVGSCYLTIASNARRLRGIKLYADKTPQAFPVRSLTFADPVCPLDVHPEYS